MEAEQHIEFWPQSAQNYGKIRARNGSYKMGQNQEVQYGPKPENATWVKSRKYNMCRNQNIQYGPKTNGIASQVVVRLYSLGWIPLNYNKWLDPDGEEWVLTN